MGRRKGFGPVQLANHAGLARRQVERGQLKGLIPAPALNSGRWSNEQADDVKARRDQIIEVLGTHHGYGASRGAQLLAQAPHLAGKKLEVWACDIEQLAERGLLECVGKFEGYALYDERQLTSPTSEMCAALEQIVTERVAWLQASARTDEAAGRCGWEVAEFEKAAEEQGIAPGRFGRWALEDVERLAGNEDLGADILCADARPGAGGAAPGYPAPGPGVLHRGRMAGTDQPRTAHGVVGRPRPPEGRRDADVPGWRPGRAEGHPLGGLEGGPGDQARPALSAAGLRPAGTAAAVIVRAFVDELRETFDLPVWARFASLDNRWLIDWEPGLDGAPSRDDVAALLAGNPVVSRFADGIQLLSKQGRTIHWARRMLQPGVACVLDTETHALWGRVMKIAAVDAATGEVLLESLVNPQIPVTEDSFDLHKITDAMVADAPTWDQVLPEVLRVTAGRKILTYNAEYDKTAIMSDCLRVEADPQHLRERDRWGCIMRKRSDWESMRDFLPLGGRHHALGDTCAALEVLMSLASAPEWVLERTKEKVSA
ncbi:exonuclease domain-containing protein [Streptomyces sp. HC307]|uniref:exonuclease domain-containing protein n=1 Tax=Streptomyces flavusporus TaxID=3385496 RepID=UPI003916E7B3